MITMEIIDKAADISRDYLVAPTATTAAPAMDVLPKPWPEFIIAFLFVVLTFTIKSFHKHYRIHHPHNPGGPAMSSAGDLRTGDVFYHVAPEEYLAMSTRDKNRLRRVKVIGLGPECRQDPSRVHLATDHGNWCIPFVAPVTRVQSHSRPAPKSRTLASA